MGESAPAGGVISLGMVIGACLGLAVTPLIVSGRAYSIQDYLNQESIQNFIFLIGELEFVKFAS